MTKRFTAALFVVLVGFMATGCASGGYLGNNPYPGPLGQVMAGNLAMTCPGDYFVGPPINRCLRSLGGHIGRYSSHPTYAGGMGGVARIRRSLLCLRRKVRMDTAAPMEFRRRQAIVRIGRKGRDPSRTRLQRQGSGEFPTEHPSASSSGTVINSSRVSSPGRACRSRLLREATRLFS